MQSVENGEDLKENGKLQEIGSNFRIPVHISGIDRQPRNLTIFQNVHVVKLNHGSRMCYFPVAYCIPLSFSLRFYYFLTRTGSFFRPQVRLTCQKHVCGIVATDANCATILQIL